VRELVQEHDHQGHHEVLELRAREAKNVLFRQRRGVLLDDLLAEGLTDAVVGTPTTATADVPPI
jgi:hypothetical protein